MHTLIILTYSRKFVQMSVVHNIPNCARSYDAHANTPMHIVCGINGGYVNAFVGVAPHQARFRGVSVWALKTSEVVQRLREPSATHTGAQRAADIYRSIMADFRHQSDFVTDTFLPDATPSKGWDATALYL